MKDVQLQAAKLFSRCFSEEEFKFVRVQPQIIEATRNLKTIDDALDTIELRGRLIREKWKLVTPEPNLTEATSANSAKP